MIATIISIIVAVYLWFHPALGAMITPATAVLMACAALCFLFFIPIGMLLAWFPLQKAEQNSTPRVMELFRQDRQVLFISFWLAIFPLFTIVIIADALYLHTFNASWLFAAWVVFFGIAIDAVRHFARHVSNYLNPFIVIKRFTKVAKECIQNEKEMDLCNWIDALAEIALKGVHRYSTAIAHEALGDEQTIARLFLEASKSISHHEQDRQSQALGITDKVSYTLFYLYQRLDTVFEGALANKLETTCSYIITLMGKISIDAAKYDVTIASPPIRFLGKFAKHAQDAGLEETALTATCIFSEVAKAIINTIDIHYYQIKDPFFSIINGLEVLAKGTFRRDKTTNIALLMQPFKELRELFKSDKAKDHQDTSVIVQNIDRVLGEFEALEVVMKTIPPIPVVNEEEELPPPPPPPAQNLTA